MLNKSLGVFIYLIIGFYTYVIGLFVPFSVRVRLEDDIPETKSIVFEERNIFVAVGSIASVSAPPSPSPSPSEGIIETSFSEN